MKDSLGNVLIFGDSYSTYAGYIPDGYDIYYFPAEDPARELEDGDGSVRTVDRTWWMELIHDTRSHLVMNNSWSGSTICYTGYAGYYPEQAFVKRMSDCYKDGKCLGEKIDTVIIFGGTNDSWADSPVGDIIYENWNDENLRACLPAFSCMVDLAVKSGARVISIGNTDIKNEITEGMREISAHYGVEYVQLHGIDKVNGHPTEKGMRQIADQIIEAID